MLMVVVMLGRMRKFRRGQVVKRDQLGHIEIEGEKFLFEHPMRMAAAEATSLQHHRLGKIFADQQKVVQDAGKAACVEERRVNRALTADGVKSLKDKGVTVYTPQAAEIAQFKAATQKPVIDWLKTKVDQKWIDAVLVAVKDAEAKK